jgi:hypothetical protein
MEEALYANDLDRWNLLEGRNESNRQFVKTIVASAIVKIVGLLGSAVLNHFFDLSWTTMFLASSIIPTAILLRHV